LNIFLNKIKIQIAENGTNFAKLYKLTTNDKIWENAKWEKGLAKLETYI